MSNSRARQLSTFCGYLQVFYDNCRITETYGKAWELTEREHFEVFGWNRYSCYESFCVVRKKNKEKNLNNE